MKKDNMALKAREVKEIFPTTKHFPLMPNSKSSSGFQSIFFCLQVIVCNNIRQESSGIQMNTTVQCMNYMGGYLTRRWSWLIISGSHA